MYVQRTTHLIILQYKTPCIYPQWLYIQYIPFNVSTSTVFQLRFNIHRHIQASFVLPSHLPYLICLFKLGISSNLSQLGFKSRFFSLLNKQENSI